MQTDHRCPRCLAPLVSRWSRLATYLICPNFPNCKSPLEMRKRPVRSENYTKAIAGIARSAA